MPLDVGTVVRLKHDQKMIRMTVNASREYNDRGRSAAGSRDGVMDGFFEPLPIKHKPVPLYSVGSCADCGQKGELISRRCPKCGADWNRMVYAAHRALR